VIIAGFLFWTTWFFWALARFHAKKNPKADYHGIKSKLPYIPVAFMVVADFTLLFGLSIPFWHDEVNAVPESGEDVTELRVLAQQFQWNIHYPGPDGVFGRTDNTLIDGALNFSGLDSDDPNREEDVGILDQMHLPVDKPVLIHLSSKYMVHSLNLPEFRIKHDAVPGMRIPIYFTPNLTTTEFREQVGNPERDFEMACAQLCGNNHFTMRGYLTVETQDAFDAWYAAELERKSESAEDDWFFEE
jgi:cytochrome c oxidase subunit 2